MSRLALALSVVGLASPAAGDASYSWPVRPFHEQHPIRGGFCDPRIGDHHQAFHFGVDIAARDGTPVYAVAPGVVWLTPSWPRTVAVVVGPRHVFSYWHVVPTVASGESVWTHEVLGHVVHGAGHVHLTEHVDGVAVNPLRPNGLAPYRDVLAPLVPSLTVQRGGVEVPATRVDGRVDLVAEVFDPPQLSLAPPWADSVLTPATVAWRLIAADGGVVIPLRTVFDCAASKPADDRFWSVFAPGTLQNHPREPGAYRYWLVHGLDTTQWPDGEYTVQVVAADVRDNVRVATFPITIRNEGAAPSPLPQRPVG